MLVDADVSEKHTVSHLPGLKRQGREIGGLYGTRKARVDRREPIRGKESGTGIRTNREPTVSFQGPFLLSIHSLPRPLPGSHIEHM
jgi:hypothetical protein